MTGTSLIVLISDLDSIAAAAFVLGIVAVEVVVVAAVTAKRFESDMTEGWSNLEVIIAAFSMFNNMSTAACAAFGDFTRIAKTLW